MHGADTFTEGLFTLKKLDDFVPANHPLRVIRTMVNKALAEMGHVFAQMYEDETSRAGAPALHQRSCYGPCCCGCCTQSAPSTS
jgi:hypothetical protein